MTCTSYVSENRLVPRDSFGRISVHMTESQFSADARSLKSIGDNVLYPTVKITPAEFAKRLGTGWHWWFSETIRVPVGRKIEFRFQGPMHLLALYSEGIRKNGETCIDGLPPSKLRSFGRKLTFVPAGCAYHEWHETGASTNVTFLYVDPAAFQKAEDFPPRLYFEDSLAWETAFKLKNTIESSQEKCLSYLSALSDVLGYELSRVNQKLICDSIMSRGGLASWQRRLVVDYIEEHVGEQISLLTLAELAQLSLHHFCRAFKQSFGIPAHQHQVQRRMEIAKVLLADRTTSITDIAFNLGYAQTSSFSTAFRKTTGWTPTAYRREFK